MVSYIAHALNWLLMIGMPLGLGVVLTRRFHFGWRLWFVGAAGFVISQVGHIPFNALLTALFSPGTLAHLPAGERLLVSAAILGLSAGLFEEITRFLVMLLWAKDARSWRKGVLLGAGHGGAEAIILGGLVLYAFLQMVAFRGADLSRLVPASQLALARQQITAYWSAPWYEDLLGALERLFTIPVQICLSVIVLQALTRNHLGWLGLAIGWHAIIDGMTVFLSGRLGGLPWGVYAIEGLVGVFSLISVGVLLALRQPEPPEGETTPVAPLRPFPRAPLEVEETPERLEQTRYD
ncbi:MAG: YhfC family glutamic-type intramembrane protease [Anaerolineales bacterium]|jgi:uncharacterized membrane protein YhfC